MRFVPILIINALVAYSPISIALDPPFSLKESVYKTACESYLNSRARIPVVDKPLGSRFWFAKDEKRDSEIAHYKSLLPPEAKIVQPEIREGDKDLLYASELNNSEEGYVLVYFQGRKPMFAPVRGMTGVHSLLNKDFVKAIATILLENVEHLNDLQLVVAGHTHPHYSFLERGKDLASNELSDADLTSSTLTKYVFETFGFKFPLLEEIIFDRSTEGPRSNTGVAKKGVYFPSQMTTPVDAVDSFSEREKRSLEYYKKWHGNDSQNSAQRRLKDLRDVVAWFNLA